MKIESFKKTKNNKYKITLSNGEVLELYDYLITKYELLRTKQIDVELENELLIANMELDAYYKAIKYLTKKNRSEDEVRKCLQDFTSDVVDKTITLLYDEGYLNNDNYIKAYVNDAVNLKNIGPVRIENELKKLGFREDEIDSYLSKVSDNVWLDKIRRIIGKTLECKSSYGPNRIKDKIYYDLINKGFRADDVNLIMDEYSFNNNSDIAKEYYKIRLKLSKKYSGDELKYYCAMKLKQKGFLREDIEKMLEKN